MLERMTIQLSTEEREAMQALADLQIRPIREQIRHVVRNELERHGLLASPAINDMKDEKDVEGQPAL